MVPAQRFEQVVAWQKCHALTLHIYGATKSFPREELFGLTSQMRRAAFSAPANIAEGFKRRGRPDKVRFLNIAQGSLEELRYYLILSRDLKYLHDYELLNAELDEASRLLAGYTAGILSRALKSRNYCVLYPVSCLLTWPPNTTSSSSAAAITV